MKQSKSNNSIMMNQAVLGMIAIGIICGAIEGLCGFGMAATGNDTPLAFFLGLMFTMTLGAIIGGLFFGAVGVVLSALFGLISGGSGSRQATDMAASPPQVTSHNRLRSAIIGAIIAVSGVAVCGTMIGVSYGGLDSTGKSGSALVVAILIALGAAMIGGWLGSKPRSIQ